MADRTVVFQRSVVSLSLGILLVATSIAPAADGPTAPAPPPMTTKDKAAPTAPLPIEQTPYKIRAWISVDPRARVDSRGRETLIRNYELMVQRFVGPPWQLEVAKGDGPLAINALEELTAKEMLPLTKGFDKGWLIRIEPGEGGGLSLAGREFDALTSKVGLLCRRTATVLPDAPRSLLQLSMDIFAPIANIGSKTTEYVKLHLQAGLLQSSDPVGQIVPKGTIFRAVQIFYLPDGGGVSRIDVIKNTYCTVESIEGGVATCKINTKLGDPFTNKVIGRDKKVAIGVKPASIPTRLRFLTSDNKPAAGYKLTAKAAPNGKPREVGATDREGRIVLEPNFAEGLVIVRLLAADIEPLTELYLIPGERVEELPYKIDPRSEAVRVETEIAALRDEIIDLLAVRRRLEKRIQARVENKDPEKTNWDEAKVLIDEFRSLPQREVFEKRLEQYEELLKKLQREADEAKLRKFINTGMAQTQVRETLAIIANYLNDVEIEAYERAYKEYQSQARGGANAVKALPKAPTIGGGSKANSTEITPVGAGFKVTMPGPPTPSIGKTSDGVSEIRTNRYNDPTRGDFLAEYWDYPGALTEEDAGKAIDAERERLLASIAGAKLSLEAPMTYEGRTGQEIIFELPAKESGIAMGMLSRIFVVKNRVYSLSFIGTKNDLKGTSATEFLNSFKLTGGAGKAPSSTTESTPPPAAPEKKAGKTPPPKSPAKPPGGANPF